MVEREGLIRSLRELTPSGRLRRPNRLRRLVEQGSLPHPSTGNKNRATRALFLLLAEREGFEPPVPARGQRI